MECITGLYALNIPYTNTYTVANHLRAILDLIIDSVFKFLAIFINRV